ncbi:MAG TPA: hypothetical protein VGL77_05610, partial [Armatimonadota bacterium]
MSVKSLPLAVSLLFLPLLLGCIHKQSPTNNHSAQPTTVAAEKVTTVGFPSGMHPVLHNGMLMGGLLNGKIVDNTTMRKALTGTEEYRCYTQTALVGRGYAQSVEDTDFGYYVTVGDKPKDNSPKSPLATATGDTPPQDASHATSFKWDIAVCGEWNAIPRIPSKGNSRLPEIQQAVRRELARHGITKPQVNIRSVWEIDLDGDGTQEMVVDALTKNFADELFKRATPGDYACVILMQKQRQDWTSAVIDGEFFTKASLSDKSQNDSSIIYSTQGFYDADGDGAIEILVQAML